jgi:hypothetical protein
MKQELEMMRVLRVPPLGKLVIEVNEERFANLAEVSNPKMRHRLLAAIGELVDFSGGYEVLEDAGIVPQLTPTAPPQTEEANEPISTGQLRQQEEFLATLEKQVEAEKSKPPKKGLAGAILTSSKEAAPMLEISESGEVKSTAIPPKQLSIAEQINLILQKHIAAQPEMANRGIRLEQGPAGALQILVDGNYYEKPGDIEDAAVREMIKTAVKEWNATQ